MKMDSANLKQELQILGGTIGIVLQPLVHLFPQCAFVANRKPGYLGIFKPWRGFVNLSTSHQRLELAPCEVQNLYKYEAGPYTLNRIRIN